MKHILFILVILLVVVVFVPHTYAQALSCYASPYPQGCPSSSCLNYYDQLCTCEETGGPFEGRLAVVNCPPPPQPTATPIQPPPTTFSATGSCTLYTNASGDYLGTQVQINGLPIGRLYSGNITNGGQTFQIPNASGTVFRQFPNMYGTPYSWSATPFGGGEGIQVGLPVSFSDGGTCPAPPLPTPQTLSVTPPPPPILTCVLNQLSTSRWQAVPSNSNHGAYQWAVDGIIDPTTTDTLTRIFSSGTHTIEASVYSINDKRYISCGRKTIEIIPTPTPTRTPTTTPTPTPSATPPPLPIVKQFNATWVVTAGSGGPGADPLNNSGNFKTETHVPGSMIPWGVANYSSGTLLAGVSQYNYDYYFKIFGPIAQEHLISSVDEINRDGIYMVSSSYTLASSGALLQNKKVVVFVPGDLRIFQSFNMTGTGSVLFIVDGNVTIDGNVDTVNAIIMATKQFNTGFDPATKLSAKGSWIVFGGPPSFNLQRKVAEKNIPSEKVEYDQKAVLDLARVIGTSSYIWEEIAP